MTKADLVKAIAVKAGITQKQANVFVDAFVSTVTEALSKGEEVKLIELGTFKVRTRAERRGKNPRTGEEIVIPVKKVPAFKAAKKLKEAVR